MSSSLLEQLPTEVLDMIFSNVRTPYRITRLRTGVTAVLNHYLQITVKIDLSALCLVSRRLSQIATPYLYRNLELRDFNSASRGWAGFSTSVTNFLSSSGISSIRSLTLGIGDDFDALSRPLNGLILQLIPDSLYRFQYDCSHRPSSQELWYLWKTQRRLTNLQLDFTLSPYAEVIQKAKTEFAGATKGRHIGPSRSIHTAVWFDGIKLKPAAVKEFLQPEYALYDAYSLWRAVKDNLQDLRALTDIREVQVSFNLQLLSVSEVEQMLAMILNDRLEKIIYRATNIPTLRSLLQPQALRQLSFHYTDFRDTPAPSERFSSITHLELMECLHVRGLLKWLVLSNLVSLTFQHHDRHGHSPVLGVGVSDVEILLSRIRRVSGLKHFVLDCPICIANFRCKFVAAIMAHKSSLESLLINNCDCIHWKEPSAMCAIYECKYLKQLSIPLHPSTLLAYYRVSNQTPS